MVSRSVILTVLMVVSALVVLSAQPAVNRYLYNYSKTLAISVSLCGAHHAITMSDGDFDRSESILLILNDYADISDQTAAEYVKQYISEVASPTQQQELNSLKLWHRQYTDKLCDIASHQERIASDRNFFEVVWAVITGRLYYE